MSCVARMSTTLAARVLPHVTRTTLVVGACLAQKRKAWGDLRKCQASAEAKVLKGKPADLGKCLTTLQGKLAKIGGKATKAAIGCRYRDNGDDSITDFDTGLMWEKKIDQAFGFPCELSNLPTCWTHQFSWDAAMTAFISELNGFTDSPSSQLGHAGHTDWRLPTLAELQTILLAPSPCGTDPRIDPIFGPTVSIYMVGHNQCLRAGQEVVRELQRWEPGLLRQEHYGLWAGSAS